jgi:hypothetical protein
VRKPASFFQNQKASVYGQTCTQGLPLWFRPVSPQVFIPANEYFFLQIHKPLLIELIVDLDIFSHFLFERVRPSNYRNVRTRSIHPHMVPACLAKMAACASHLLPIPQFHAVTMAPLIKRIGWMANDNTSGLCLPTVTVYFFPPLSGDHFAFWPLFLRWLTGCWFAKCSLRLLGLKFRGGMQRSGLPNIERDCR